MGFQPEQALPARRKSYITKLPLYYRCPNHHIFELKSKVRTYFCQLCKKLYSVTVDLTRLVKDGRTFYECTSKQGKQLLSKIRKRIDRELEVKRNWKREHGREVYLRNRQHELSRNERYQEEHADEIKAWKKNYNKSYNQRPEVKAYNRDRIRAMRGLAMLGLGKNPDESYNRRKNAKVKLANLPPRKDIVLTVEQRQMVAQAVFPVRGIRGVCPNCTVKMSPVNREFLTCLDCGLTLSRNELRMLAEVRI